MNAAFLTILNAQRVKLQAHSHACHCFGCYLAARIGHAWIGSAAAPQKMLVSVQGGQQASIFADAMAQRNDMNAQLLSKKDREAAKAAQQRHRSEQLLAERDSTIQQLQVRQHARLSIVPLTHLGLMRQSATQGNLSAEPLLAERDALIQQLSLAHPRLMALQLFDCSSFPTIALVDRRRAPNFRSWYFTSIM